MKKQTKEELIKEFSDWIEQGYPLIWYRNEDDKQWYMTEKPLWNKNSYWWLIHDERIDIRKMFADGEPVYAKGIDGLVVRFDSLTSGTVVEGNDNFKKGYYSTAWADYFDTSAWGIYPEYKEIEENNQIYLIINSDFKNPKALSDDIKKAIELVKEEASKSTSSDFIVSIFETPINSLNKYGDKIAEYEVKNNQLNLTFLEEKYQNIRELFNIENELNNIKVKKNR